MKHEHVKKEHARTKPQGAHLRIVNPHTWPHGRSKVRIVPKVRQSNTRKKKAKGAKQGPAKGEHAIIKLCTGITRSTKAKRGRATNYPHTNFERSGYGQADVTGVTGLAIQHCTQNRGERAMHHQVC